MERVLLVLMIALTISGCGGNSSEQIKEIDNIAFLDGITIEYGEDISEKEYHTKADIQELIIRLSDNLEPKVDSMVVGEREHTFVCDEGNEYKFNINVKDTQFPEIKGEDKYDIKLSEVLSAQKLLNESLVATDPVDGNLELVFDLPKITVPGEYTVQIFAKDSNNNEVDNTVVIVVEDDQEETVKKSNTGAVITYKELITYKDIGYKTTRKNDASIPNGEEVITKQGIKGQNKIVTTVKYSDGKEVTRSSKTVLIKNPVNKVILVGTKVKEKDKLTAVTNCPQITAMVNKINADRQAAGLNALSVSSELTRAAGVRVLEITEKFSHERLDGSRFYTVSKLAFGENIAYGSADGIVTHGRFMDSPGHKDNILNTRWNIVGIATVDPVGMPTHWVVLFGQ